MPTVPKATIAVIGGKKKIKKISDLTIEQLRVLIEEIVEQRLEEYLGDPDAGLELRPEFVRKLKRSLAHPPKNVIHCRKSPRGAVLNLRSKYAHIT